MRKALLLSYYFPPRVATGSLRATHLAKYLPSFGWEVTVVTPRFSMGAAPSWATVVETGYTDVIARFKGFVGIDKDISAHVLFGSSPPRVGSDMTIKQRFLRSAYKMLLFPDPQMGWFNHGVRAVGELLAQHRYDALISTSAPYTAHLIARRALFGKRVPWLADLRDAWRGNHYATSSIRSALDSILEWTTLRKAAAITTVSQPLAHLIAVNNPRIPTFDIPNAFDADDWADITFKRPDRFTITYAGSLLQGFRDPEPLFDALLEEFQAATMRRESVEIIFYARKEEWLVRAIEQRGLQDVVTIKGYVERNKVLSAERATSVNLLLLRDHPAELGVYTGKLFEYIGAGLPIIAIGGPEQSVVKTLLARIGPGWYARTRVEIRNALLTLYRMHNSGSTLRLDARTSEEFSATTMAKRFVNVLESAHWK